MDDWRYEPAPDLEQSLAERLRRFPREPDMLVYGLRSLAALVVRAWLRLYHRFEIVGGANLPRSGSFVIVANHSSHLDALCLSAAMPLSMLHRVFPAAAKDYFFVRLPRLALAAVVVNALPFERRVRGAQSLTLCQRLLENPGNVLILFPEGTRSTNGELGEFKPGIGRLLAGTPVPVVPACLKGAFEAWPKGRFLPRPRRVRLVLGTPRVFASSAMDKAAVLAISRELRDAVEELRQRV